nr:acyl carrier protein [Mycolicibacterium insubricum]
MPPDAAIEACLHEFDVDPMVMAIDGQRLRLFVDTDLRTGHREPDPDDRAPSPGGDIQDIPAAVRTELAAVLRVAEPAELDLQASLFDLGIDSLLALDLRKRLQRATGRKIALATLLGGVTGSALIDELAGRRATIRRSTESGFLA